MNYTLCVTTAFGSNASLTKRRLLFHSFFILILCGAMAAGMISCKSSSPVGPASPPSGGSGIGPNGGTVTSADGNVTVVIPPGALSTNQSIAISARTDSNTCPQASGPEYDLTPNGLTFSKPVMLTLNYDTTLPGTNAMMIGVASEEDTGDWYGWTGGSVDTIHHTVTVPITHFSHASDYLAYKITPSNTVVFVGQSLGFEVDATGAPATDSAGNPVKLNPFVLVDGALNWHVSGGGTLDNAQNNTVLYTAPQEMPSPNTVTLAANIPGYGMVLAFIHVVSKNWQLRLNDSLEQLCPGMITYHYYNGGYIDFQVSPSDGGTGIYAITGYSWFADAPYETDGICPEESSLISSYKVNYGNDSKINDVHGSYNARTNKFNLTLDQTDHDLPGFDITLVVGGTEHKDIDVGKNFSAIYTPTLMPTQSILVDNHSAGSYWEHRTITLSAIN